jgi:hypothetical protein
MVPPHLGQMRGSIVWVGTEAVTADHNLSFVRDVSGYPQSISLDRGSDTFD